MDKRKSHNAAMSVRRWAAPGALAAPLIFAGYQYYNSKPEESSQKKKQSALGLPSTCDHIWIRAEVTSKPPRGAEFEVGVDTRSLFVV